MTTFQELHRIACESGADAYSDPMTGYRVFTELKLLRQGDCCGNACRHCPFGHIKVSNLESEPRIQKPVVLGSLKGRCDSFDVLFWSGGKDSFLCLSHLLENDKNIVLLTTFSVDTNRVPIQNVHIKDIVQQASFFNVPVCLVPIPQNSNYRDTVSAGLRAIVLDGARRGFLSSTTGSAGAATGASAPRPNVSPLYTHTLTPIMP